MRCSELAPRPKLTGSKRVQAFIIILLFSRGFRGRRSSRPRSGVIFRKGIIGTEALRSLSLLRLFAKGIVVVVVVVVVAAVVVVVAGPGRRGSEWVEIAPGLSGPRRGVVRG